MHMFIAGAMAAVSLVAAQSANAHETSRAADVAAVTAVLGEYRSAIERLDASGTERLFVADSQIFENGGVEGSYTNYLSHHLGPELRAFRSFRFSEVNVDIRFEGPVALATESYGFRIEPAQGDPVERRGVTTSVLRKDGNVWRIVSLHGSSRAPRRPAASN
ncbi:nuclear transport factor 2 family protein [Sphingosinicella sp. LHD-64]|uniref:YybH family protein n=1 Tax=Sphingosinicella sp. LHD-64 TaxID=3072139 RepID=UPI00280CB61F|nr:nuclear transport factor 2 family protein [Sphingosinicella sp. LHD-64]MDQ8757396.1 nuclear transport factor 2 family protein [Sphingosinicella sp. LHD-64]